TADAAEGPQARGRALSPLRDDDRGGLLLRTPDQLLPRRADGRPDPQGPASLAPAEVAADEPLPRRPRTTRHRLTGGVPLIRTRTIVPLIAIAALLAIPTLASAATINLGDSFFSPDSKTVSVGSTVKFNWTGKKKHNVTKKSGPGGAFNSVTTKSDGIHFTKTFTRAGVYKLFCTVHPDMHLKITVQR